ncbi:DUF1134 domain-containing protein [Sphingosinicella sp.]|uniref:DUF1134 domain-containing protein n=1 Tax=Sphingosinicella sp. TaxID=1917971 RepID=UPI0017A61110|nr:DUF1134 domain-containing protein [Sphingosinicella sp.]MBA4757415.1 DUF1134 domain-containing protein [Sphingosinicella sp.]
MFRMGRAGLAVFSLMLLAATARAQDANADLAPVPGSEAAYGTMSAEVPPSTAPVAQTPAAPPPPPPSEPSAQSGVPAAPATTAAPGAVGDGDLQPVFSQSEVLTAAENVFGRGAEGLARMIETVFKDLGQPNAYVAGREGGGAIGVGVRYGEGKLYHKVEGEMPIYWRGPSIGFDVGADGSKTFILIYKLYDTQELFRAYPAAEGKAYIIGGLSAQYVQRGDVVIVPIKLGVGWRLGVNAGYLRFSKKKSFLPF